MRETKLARIREASLGSEDHGIFTYIIDLEYSEPGYKIGGSGQGFGMYGLDAPLREPEDGKFVRRVGTAYGMDSIMQLMRAVGAKDWRDIPGKMVWADAEHHKVHSITGVDTGITFDPEQLLQDHTQIVYKPDGGAMLKGPAK